MGCGLRLKAWTIEVISQSHLGSEGIQSHVGIGGVAIGEVGDRSSDVEVEPSCQDDVGIKVGIDISRHLGTDDVVGGIGVGVVRIPAEGETEVPLVVEGNSLAAKDACSLEEIDRDGIAQLGIELMVGESDTLVCPFVNLGNRRVRVFHEGIFELVGRGMVHRALLRVVAHQELIGMQDAARTEVGAEEMNLVRCVQKGGRQGVF